MYPTLEDGDNLLIDKISYRFQEPERFDIIVFRYPHARDTYYIKRIIGLPGETVLIQDGQIYINGELLEDPYGAEPMENPGRAYRQITLGPGEYFVLGDNRNVSSDSRDSSVGNVTTEQIVGKVFLRIYPWKQMGKVE
jgi:signal peptidase I